LVVAKYQINPLLWLLLANISGMTILPLLLFLLRLPTMSLCDTQDLFFVGCQQITQKVQTNLAEIFRED